MKARGLPARASGRLLRGPLALATQPLVLFVALWLLAVGALELRGLTPPGFAQGAHRALRIKLRLPAGATPTAAEGALRAVQQAAQSLPGVERADPVPGTAGWFAADPVYAAELAITLRPPADRAAEERSLRELRSRLGAATGLEFEITRADAEHTGPRGGSTARRYVPRL